MTGANVRAPSDGDARVEHDALARRLEIRASVDEVRRGAMRLFLGLIAVGLTVKLAWDRWGTLNPGVVRRVDGRPVFLWVAGAAAIALLALSLRAFLRARRLAREEDRLYARFREVRAALGMDR